MTLPDAKPPQIPESEYSRRESQREHFFCNICSEFNFRRVCATLHNIVSTLRSNVNNMSQLQTHSHNICNTADKHLQHPDTSCTTCQHVCTQSAHVCTNVAHMSAHVCTCLQSLCKGSAKLCKGSAKPRKPPKPRKVLCRAFAGQKTRISGFSGSRREKTPNPGIGPFGPHLPLYKRLKVSKLRQKSTNSRRF